jgi:glycosyl transferase family 2
MTVKLSKQNNHMKDDQKMPMAASTPMEYSLIIMADEYHADTLQMIQDLNQYFFKRQTSFEVLVINNGTGPELNREINQHFPEAGQIKYIEFLNRTADAVCLKSALKEIGGEVIVIYGSYQQITNDSLSKLLEAVKDPDVDIVSPWRQHRIDNRFNQFQSKAYNVLVNAIAQIKMHDLGCKVKVMKREVLEHTNFYGDLYPYLPILAEMRGYRTTEIKCDHYLDHGKTGIYGLSMYFNRIVEILTLYFNTRFTRKPLRFFSAVGVGFLLIGIAITTYVFMDKIFFGNPIGDRPVLLLAILFSVIGIQAASVGLLGEIIAFIYGRHRKEYSVREIA